MRALGLSSVRVPDGELAKVEGLESLVINGGSAERIDLSGCTSLRQLMVSHVRGLEEVLGVEELTTLAELDLYALPQVRSFPPLGRLTRLWRLDLGSMKGLTTGLSPFLAAPNLREVQLASTFTIAPGDAELLRDHARVVGFSWWDLQGHPGRGRRQALRGGRPPGGEDAEVRPAT